MQQHVSIVWQSCINLAIVISYREFGIHTAFLSPSKSQEYSSKKDLMSPHPGKIKRISVDMPEH